MISKFLGGVVAIALAFGVFYYFNFGGVKDLLNTKVTNTNTSENQNNISNNYPEENINNYEECIAAGNKPLPEAPDKCLTKAGHVFIEGVIEE